MLILGDTDTELVTDKLSQLHAFMWFKTMGSKRAFPGWELLSKLTGLPHHFVLS